ncbi:MAG: response regulator [Chromatiales bacterium]|nr:response regulator [Chromatiales bacterium]
MTARILIVDDDPAICEMTHLMLKGEGYQCEYALNVDQAIKKINNTLPDLLLVDWMMPKTDGIDLVLYLRNLPETADIPIIMLTAKDRENDKVKALELGCDDYMVKPFSKVELSARIKALLRRTKPHKQHKKISLGVYNIDPMMHRFTVDNQTINLSATEFRLLYFMMVNSNQVLSRPKILSHVWDRNKYIEERTVDVHIKRLRKLLRQYNADRVIETIRGVGYRFVHEQ